jgi:hypothetical protein
VRQSSDASCYGENVVLRSVESGGVCLFGCLARRELGWIGVLGWRAGSWAGSLALLHLGVRVFVPLLLRVARACGFAGGDVVPAIFMAFVAMYLSGTRPTFGLFWTVLNE